MSWSRSRGRRCRRSSPRTGTPTTGRRCRRSHRRRRRRVRRRRRRRRAAGRRRRAACTRRRRSPSATLDPRDHRACADTPRVRSPCSTATPRASPHLFTGDSLFPGGVGKTSSPEDFVSLIDDVEARVFDVLPDETWFYPGPRRRLDARRRAPAPRRMARARLVAKEAALVSNSWRCRRSLSAPFPAAAGARMAAMAVAP